MKHYGPRPPRWLRLLNFFVFQWFFVRLALEVPIRRGKIHWGFFGPTLPLSGWCSPYRLRPHYRRIR